MSLTLEPVLTEVEAKNLETYEQIIRSGLQTFKEVGAALCAIRDQALHRATHPTFEAYCRDKWALSQPRAYQLMGASEVVDRLAQDSTIVELPSNESQVRPLTRLSPEDASRAWAEAVATAPGGHVTGAHVARIVDQYRDVPGQLMLEAEDEDDGPIPEIQVLDQLVVTLIREGVPAGKSEPQLLREYMARRPWGVDVFTKGWDALVAARILKPAGGGAWRLNTERLDATIELARKKQAEKAEAREAEWKRHWQDLQDSKARVCSAIKDLLEGDSQIKATQLLVEAAAKETGVADSVVSEIVRDLSYAGHIDKDGKRLVWADSPLHECHQCGGQTFDRKQWKCTNEGCLNVRRDQLADQLHRSLLFVGPALTEFTGAFTTLWQFCEHCSKLGRSCCLPACQVRQDALQELLGSIRNLGYYRSDTDRSDVEDGGEEDDGEEELGDDRSALPAAR